MKGVMRKLNRIHGPVSKLQLREITTDMAFMNLSLKERPQYFSTWNREKEEISLMATIPAGFELVETLDYRLRGALMRRAIEDVLPSLIIRDMSDRKFQEALTEGLFTFLFDRDGNFIENSFEKLDT
jgi:hypothetical protein